MVVTDVPRPREPSCVGRGVEVSDVQEFPWGLFVYFRDPDGNAWALQQLPAGAR